MLFFSTDPPRFLRPGSTGCTLNPWVCQGHGLAERNIVWATRLEKGHPGRALPQNGSYCVRTLLAAGVLFPKAPLQLDSGASSFSPK